MSSMTAANSGSLGRRGSAWLVANALLWMAVGGAATLLIERVRDRRPTLGDLADEAIERMQVLDLSEPQKSELARIRADWRNEVLAEESGSLERLDRAAATADAKVAALLTPEQALRYRELALAPRSK